MLWNAGISFGGVVSFIFADLIILPILVIYKKYYGTRMMLFVLASFYATMVAAGYIVELLFTLLGLVPTVRDAKVGQTTIQWDYTTVLNIVALLVAVYLGYRFIRTGGMPMLKMMGGSPDGDHDHDRGSHDHSSHHHVDARSRPAARRVSRGISPTALTGVH